MCHDLACRATPEVALAVVGTMPAKRSSSYRGDESFRGDHYPSTVLFLDRFDAAYPLQYVARFYIDRADPAVLDDGGAPINIAHYPPFYDRGLRRLGSLARLRRLSWCRRHGLRRRYRAGDFTRRGGLCSPLHALEA